MQLRCKMFSLNGRRASAGLSGQDKADGVMNPPSPWWQEDMAAAFSKAEPEQDGARVLLEFSDSQGNLGALSLPTAHFEAALPAIEDAVTDASAIFGGHRWLAYVGNPAITLNISGGRLLIDITVPRRLPPTRVSLSPESARAFYEAIGTLLRG